MVCAVVVPEQLWLPALPSAQSAQAPPETARPPSRARALGSLARRKGAAKERLASRAIAGAMPARGMASSSSEVSPVPCYTKKLFRMFSSVFFPFQLAITVPSIEGYGIDMVHICLWAGLPIYVNPASPPLYRIACSSPWRGMAAGRSDAIDREGGRNIGGPGPRGLPVIWMANFPAGTMPGEYDMR